MADQATIGVPVDLAGGALTGSVRRIRRLIFWLCVAAAVCTAGAGVGVWLLHFERLAVQPRALLPVPAFDGNRVLLTVPGYAPTAEVTTYKDELFAYLMFDHLRHYPAFSSGKLLLAFDPDDPAEPYRLIFRASDDLLAAFATGAELGAAGTLRTGGVRLIPVSRVSVYDKQTQLFDAAYNLPVRKKLEQLPRNAVENYLRRFIRFKSMTDPRIRRRLEPVPAPLSAVEAQQIAGDILTVADFYSLPLEYFLAIAAVENNYMNVRGDLQHSIWKRRPAPDDVVLEKKRGRVRVRNDSAGVWQITRETLRYTHSLYKRDTRDYSALPEHLRPPETLDVQQVSPKVLTTYAGLLLRDLLDRFDGDVTLAVSAYNGGPARPNLRYGEHVFRAAAHARRVVEGAAALNGETVVRMTWLRP
jgi:hypothetical protein